MRPQGYVDHCTGTLIDGWVWDRDLPETRFTVEILVDGELLTRVAANQYREDLEKGGFGDGTYGFKYVPSSPIDTARQRISVVVLGAGLGLSSSGQLRPVGPGARIAPGYQNLPPTRPEGRVDHCTASLIDGWIWDRDLPERRFTIEIIVDGELLTRVTAHQYREDLEKKGIGDGTYSFKYVPPAPLDPERQRIVVVVLGTGLCLSASGQLRPVAFGDRFGPGFEKTLPTHQNALDIFSGLWGSALPPLSGLVGGSSPTFEDQRVPLAVTLLGGLSGRSILELGPYEAYNTYQFQQAGATSITSIESSKINFLKCLIVKNIFGLNATFLHGDFLKYLQQTACRFDVCWASGVLYHMIQPIELLKGIRRVADATLIWTHYYDDTHIAATGNTKYFEASKDVMHSEFSRSLRLHHRTYPDQGDRSYFSGGEAPYSYWMEKDDIIFALKTLGYDRIDIIYDQTVYATGSAICLLARTEAASRE